MVNSRKRYSGRDHRRYIAGGITVLDSKAIGQRIRLRRLEMDLSQENLAELAGVSTSFIGHIERAEKSATLDTYDRICDVLGMSLDYMARGIRKRCDQQDCQLYKAAVEMMKSFGAKQEDMSWR